jgi:hypothetical protein
MRKHVSFWYLLSILGTPSYSQKDIKDHFESRFLLGELDARASVHIASVVDDASTPTVRDSFADISRHVVHTVSRTLNL